MILTDQRGVPIPRPSREDYTTDLEYIHAYHAYRDRVAEVAGRAFNEAFRKSMK